MTERQFLSLGGTEYNCAGGATPWGSWLSCEECFEYEGSIRYFDAAARRDRKHGYVFEVDAYSDELVDAVPIKAMGRFEHEACAVHEPTGHRLHDRGPALRPVLPLHSGRTRAN